MFTGLIEEVGTIAGIVERGGISRIADDLHRVSFSPSFRTTFSDIAQARG